MALSTASGSTDGPGMESCLVPLASDTVFPDVAALSVGEGVFRMSILVGPDCAKQLTKNPCRDRPAPHIYSWKLTRGEHIGTL